MSGYIDNYGRPENPVVDITGTPLAVLLNFVDKGSQPPGSDHPLLPFAALLNLPATLVASLNTPLNQIGDEVWAQVNDTNGKTMRDRTAAAITSQVSVGVQNLGSSYSAYNINVNCGNHWHYGRHCAVWGSD